MRECRSSGDVMQVARLRLEHEQMVTSLLPMLERLHRFRRDRCLFPQTQADSYPGTRPLWTTYGLMDICRITERLKIRFLGKRNGMEQKAIESVEGLIKK